MPNYSIIPVKVGSKKGNKYILMYPPEVEEVDMSNIIFLIKGGDEIVVVDTGCADSEWSKRTQHAVFEREADEVPERALAKNQVRPEDVKIVINTHLHWDHCFNNKLFPNATIFVQESELRYAVAPLPIHSHGYCCYKKEEYGGPPWIETFNQILPVKGDLEILPGISLILLPGHTPGGQGVVVETARGPYVMVGDFCPLFENWEGKGRFKHIPSGIHSSLEDYYNSFDKLDRLKAFVLPGHDAQVFKKQSYP